MLRSVTFVYILPFRSKNLLNGIWGKTRRCILQENLLNIIQLPLITDQVQLITFCVNCLRGELRLQNKFLNASLLFSFNCCFFHFQKKSRISRSWKSIMMQYQCYVQKKWLYVSLREVNNYVNICFDWMNFMCKCYVFKFGFQSISSLSISQHGSLFCLIVMNCVFINSCLCTMFKYVYIYILWSLLYQCWYILTVNCYIHSLNLSLKS